MATATKPETAPIANEQIINRIHYVRDQKVLLDYDLATLYEVETKVLNQAVKRNANRFPEDFMFRLSVNEWSLMRSQFVTSSSQHIKNLNEATMRSQIVTAFKSKRNAMGALMANLY